MKFIKRAFGEFNEWPQISHELTTPAKCTSSFKLGLVKHEKGFISSAPGCKIISGTECFSISKKNR